jgi:hypothetical protein
MANSNAPLEVKMISNCRRLEALRNVMDMACSEIKTHAGGRLKRSDVRNQGFLMASLAGRKWPYDVLRSRNEEGMVISIADG